MADTADIHPTDGRRRREKGPPSRLALPRLERVSDTECGHSEDSAGEKEAKRQRSNPGTPVSTPHRMPYDYDAVTALYTAGLFFRVGVFFLSVWGHIVDHCMHFPQHNCWRCWTHKALTTSLTNPFGGNSRSFFSLLGMSGWTWALSSETLPSYRNLMHRWGWWPEIKQRLTCEWTSLFGATIVDVFVHVTWDQTTFNLWMNFSFWCHNSSMNNDRLLTLQLNTTGFAEKSSFIICCNCPWKRFGYQSSLLWLLVKKNIWSCILCAVLAVLTGNSMFQMRFLVVSEARNSLHSQEVLGNVSFLLQLL